MSSGRPSTSVSTSWTSRLRRRSPRPRPFQAQSLVATSNTGVAARISAPELRVMAAAVVMASSYQGLENPRMSGWVGALPPTQHRCASRLLQPTLVELLAEPVVRGAACDLADDIDILGGAGRRRARLGEPEVDRRAADEDDLVQERAEQLGCDLELLRAQRFLSPARSRSRGTRRSSATRRTRGSPARRLSSSARISPSSGQSST